MVYSRFCPQWNASYNASEKYNIGTLPVLMVISWVPDKAKENYMNR